MKLYWMSVQDNPLHNWLIFDDVDVLSLRMRYRDLACDNCGKVDEYVAIERGFDPDVEVRSEANILRSDDGYICADDRFRAFLVKYGVRGARFVSLPRGKHYLMVPDIRLQVKRRIVSQREEREIDLEAIAKDINKLNTAYRTTHIDVDACGIELRDQCRACGRYDTSLYWPRRDSLEIPDGDLWIACPRVPMEHRHAQATWLITTEKVMDLLTRSRLKGFEWYESR